MRFAGTAPVRDDTGLPLVCLTHFRATLDNWDPELVDALAAERKVILVDLAGVGGSTGTTPNTVEEMASNVFAFLDAVELNRYDLLGFSLGGFIAQEAALSRPWQVRRLVLAGTAPRGGPDIHLYAAGPICDTALLDAPTPESLLVLFFEGAPPARPRESSSSSDSRCAPPSGTHRPHSPSATPSSPRSPRGAFATRPVCDDSPPSSSLSWLPTATTMRWSLPRTPTCWQSTCPTRLSIYPDAGHGFLFQHPGAVAAEVNAFLGS